MQAFEKPEHAAWVRQWKRASAALEENSIVELRAMSDDECRAAIERIMELAEAVPISPERLAYSGLVEQQKFFSRGRHEFK